MNKRGLLLGAALLLFGGFVCLHPAVHWRAVAWWRGEAMYQDKPTSYWAAEWRYWVDRRASHGRLWSRQDPWWHAYVADPTPEGEPPLLDGDPAATPVLRQLLRAERGSRVQAMAAEGLQRVGPAARPAVPDLLALLALDGDAAENLRGHAWRALGAIAPEVQREILISPPGTDLTDSRLPPAEPAK